MQNAGTHSFSIGVTEVINTNLLIELSADDVEYVYQRFVLFWAIHFSEFLLFSLNTLPYSLYVLSISICLPLNVHMREGITLLIHSLMA